MKNDLRLRNGLAIEKMNFPVHPRPEHFSLIREGPAGPDSKDPIGRHASPDLFQRFRSDEDSEVSLQGSFWTLSRRYARFCPGAVAVSVLRTSVRQLDVIEFFYEQAPPARRSFFNPSDPPSAGLVSTCKFSSSESVSDSNSLLIRPNLEWARQCSTTRLETNLKRDRVCELGRTTSAEPPPETDECLISFGVRAVSSEVTPKSILSNRTRSIPR